MEKRYEIVVWDNDIGEDERGDYCTIQEAVKAAKQLHREYPYVAIYDYQERVAYVVFGDAKTSVFSDWVRVIKW